VVGKDLERRYGGKLTLGEIEFEEIDEDGTVTHRAVDGTVTVIKPPAP
jgi:hypothetical protein